VKIKRPILVEVEWVDVLATCGWEKLEEVNIPTLKTYGYLVYKDKDSIKVSSTKDEGGDWFATHAFPRGCVKKIRPLEGGRMVKSTKKQVNNESREEDVG
jgi:hypothetical protein